MRRRFSRRRRSGGSDGRSPIDAEQWMRRILESGATGAVELEVLEV